MTLAEMTTQINPRTGELRVTFTELRDDGISSVTAVMPPGAALNLANKIMDAINQWKNSQ